MFLFGNAVQLGAMSDGNAVPETRPSAALQTIFCLAFPAVSSYQPGTPADGGNSPLPLQRESCASAESMFQLLCLSRLDTGKAALRGELKGLIQ